MARPTCAGRSNRLNAQVQEVLRQHPLSGHVFAFFNRQRNRVKLLVWERDGFWLLYKRLEAGTFAVLERDEINAPELYLLLEGIEVVTRASTVHSISHRLVTQSSTNSATRSNGSSRRTRRCANGYSC